MHSFSEEVVIAMPITDDIDTTASEMRTSLDAMCKGMVLGARGASTLVRAASGRATANCTRTSACASARSAEACGSGHPPSATD